MTLFELQSGVYNALVRAYAGVSPWIARWRAVPPLRVTLVLTNSCNLSCRFCYEKEGLNRRKPGLLTLDEWCGLIRSLPRFTVLDLIGGETFLYKDLDAILRLARERGHLVSVTTNATTLDEGRIRRLLDEKVHYLMVSIDGLGSDHDELRGRQGAFEKAVSAVRRIGELKRELGIRRPYLCVKSMLVRENIARLPEFIDYFERLGDVDEIKFSTVMESPHWYALEAHPDLGQVFSGTGTQYRYGGEAAESFKSMIDPIRRRMAGSRMKISFHPDVGSLEELASYLGEPERFAARRCPVPSHNFNVLPDGEITPCLAYRIGNVRDIGLDLRQVLHRGRHREFMARLRSEAPVAACRGCVNCGHVRRSP